MLVQIPSWLSLLFVAATFATLLFFLSAIRKVLPPKKVVAVIAALTAWLVLQTILSIRQVYSADPNAMPPRLLLLGILPPLLLIAGIFLTRTGRSFVDRLPLQQVTWLNTVRIAVEIGLYGLYLYKTVPRLMTFEGGNLDILSGLSAPLVVYFGFVQQKLSRKLMLAWNIICLGLLINIVTRALLSAPFPTQRLAFDQPNIAILHFPFIWLPAFIVPMALFGHLVSIRRLR